MVTLRQGNFKGKEEGFLETLLTGSEPDPYIVVSVLENENSLPPETFAAKLMRTFQGQKEEVLLKTSKGSFARVLDSAKSAQKVRTDTSKVFEHAVVVVEYSPCCRC